VIVPPVAVAYTAEAPIATNICCITALIVR
jgi:hypothetical protein